jgi:hypothetical protein
VLYSLCTDHKENSLPTVGTECLPHNCPATASYVASSPCLQKHCLATSSLAPLSPLLLGNVIMARRIATTSTCHLTYPPLVQYDVIAQARKCVYHLAAQKCVHMSQYYYSDADSALVSLHHMAVGNVAVFWRNMLSPSSLFKFTLCTMPLTSRCIQAFLNITCNVNTCLRCL